METALKIYAHNRRMFDLIRCGIYNATNGKIKVSGCAIDSRDTEFTYALVADGKLAKAQILFARTLAHGIAIGAQDESAVSILPL